MNALEDLLLLGEICIPILWEWIIGLLVNFVDLLVQGK